MREQAGLLRITGPQTNETLPTLAEFAAAAAPLGRSPDRWDWDREQYAEYERYVKRVRSQLDAMLEEIFQALDDFPSSADMGHISLASGMSFQAINAWCKSGLVKP
jgi:hypothetical protein